MSNRMDASLQQLQDTFGPEDLHPELEACLSFHEDLGVMILNHKFVISPMHSPVMNKISNRQFLAKQKATEEAMKEGDLYLYVVLHEKPYRMEAIMEWFEIHGAVEDLYEVVLDEWTTSENIWQNQGRWVMLLKKCGKERAFNFMTKEERRKFQSLTGSTVYRGCSPRNRKGLSWTTDLDKAVWFSRRLGPESPEVWSLELEEGDAFIFLNGRRESEVVLNPYRWRKIQERAFRT
jgi:hypothetical protein